VSEEEAVTHWYDMVYLPIVAAIREHDLRAKFPGKTETELYLSIVKYLDQQRKAEGDLTAEDAAIDYAAQFKRHPIKKILGGLLAVIVGAEATPTRSDAVLSAAAPAADQITRSD
jgi:hypothetical protein